MEPKLYKQRRFIKVALKILAIIVAAIVLICILIFFGFRKYIAYTPGGKLYLDIPWLEGYMTEQTQDGVSEIDGTYITYEYEE